MIGAALTWIGLASAASTAEVSAQGLIESAISNEGAISSRSNAPWWSSVEDPTLHQLIFRGLKTSPQMAASDAQVQIARAGRAQSFSGLLPSVSVELQGQVMPTDGIGLSPFSSQMPDYGAAFEGLAEMLASFAEASGQDPATMPSFEMEQEDSPDTYGQGSAMLVATLPIDIVGRQYRSWRASEHSYQGSVSDRAAQRQTLSLRIADAWYDLVAARAQAKIVDQQVRTNKEMLQLVKARYEGGEATALDVLQQRQQLAATQAMLPRAKAQVTSAGLALNLTMGQVPGTPLPEGIALPQVGAPPAMGTTARLMADRPDLAAAVSRLDAAQQQRVAAMLGLAPVFGITGSAGRQFLRMDETDHVDTWSVGAALTVPLFAGGRTHAGIRAAKAQRDLAQAQLRSKVLTIAQEIQTAQAQDSSSLESLTAAQRQHSAARTSFEESRARYLDGLVPYVNVLSALGADQVAELSLLDAQRTRLRARVRLHGAFGGTWSQQPLQEETP
mgnify:CR=1 FL=1